MVVHPKLLYNGAEGTVLENVTLKFEIFDKFAFFSGFDQKRFQGAGRRPGGGGAR